MAMPTADFAIIDRPRFHGLFDGKIRILDFTIEEARLTQPFLEACGLKEKFMSRCIEEDTAVEDAVISSELTDRLRLNAYALIR